MPNQTDAVTQANEEANREFNGKDVLARNKRQKAKDTQDANEAANAEFNGSGKEDVLGNRVGGLRGSAD